MPRSHLEQAGGSYNDNRFSLSILAISLVMMIATNSSTSAFSSANSIGELSASKSSSTVNNRFKTKQKTFEMAIPFSFCFDEFAQPQCHYPLEATNT